MKTPPDNYRGSNRAEYCTTKGKSERKDPFKGTDGQIFMEML